jgi:transcription antitermination factor NusG
VLSRVLRNTMYRQSVYRGEQVTNMNSGELWFALQTKARNEKKVDYLLKEKGYQCLTPVYRQKRQWSDRTVEIELPLFPMYVFCRFNPTTLGKIVSIRGVLRVVEFGGKPVEVAVDEIESLQILARSNILREPWRYLPEGTLVRVETGPLAGIQGVICTSGNKRQLIISITLLQRSVAIELDDSTLVSVISELATHRTELSFESDLAIRLLSRV